MPVYFDPLIAPLWIALFALVAGALTAAFYLHMRSKLSRAYWWLLISLKAAALLLAVLVLLNPYRLQREPDPSTFQVVYLIDASGSMETRDVTGGQSRLDLVKEQVLGDSALYRRLRAQYTNSTTYIFSSDELRRIEGDTNFGVLPGDTDIDEVLKKVLAGHNHRVKLGAVVLVTDGLDNRGRSLIDAAAPYKHAGVPIHIIGVGDSAPRNDLSAVWTDVPRKAIRAKPMRLAAEIRRNFRGETTAQVEVHESGRLIDSRTVRFGADTTAVPIQFEHTSFTSGFKTFKLHVKPLPDEENQVNNIDYAGVPVEDPEVFRVLYFSHTLDWEYKFLNLLASRQERFQLDAAIQLGTDAWFIRGLEDGSHKGLPGTEVLHNYDAIIVSLHSLQQLDEAQVETLVGFVEHRGGGLLLTGVTDALPESLYKVLPLRRLPDQIAVSEQLDLEFKSARMMARPGETDFARILKQLYLPQDSPWYRIPADDLKPGAINLAATSGEPWIVLTSQQYGAGKVVLLNLGQTWRWVMSNESGDAWYGNFWAHLIAWSTSSLQQRLILRPAGAKLALGQEQTLTLDLLDATYRPDNSARIEVRYFTPSGQSASVTFIQDPRVDGRYTAKFVPRQVGEYRWVLNATLHDGSTLSARSDYIVTDSSPEAEPAPMAEEKLRSLARITGGTYWNYRQIDRIGDLAVATQQRFIDTRHPWMGNWAFLIVAILALLPDWIFRRRIGLR